MTHLQTAKIREDLALVITEAGLPVPVAGTLAGLLTDLVKHHGRLAAAAWTRRMLESMRPTLAGTALCQVLGIGNEPIKEAARRLHVTPKTVRESVKTCRDLLNSSPPAQDSER